MPPIIQSSRLTFSAQLDVFTQLTSLAVDLDSVLQVLFVTSGIEDVVSGGDGVVNDELVGRLGGGGSGFRLMAGWWT